MGRTREDTRRVRVLLALLGMVLVLAACADGDGDVASPAASPDSTVLATPTLEPHSPTSTIEQATPEATQPVPPQATATVAPMTPVPATASPTVATESDATFDPESVTIALEVIADGFDEPLFLVHALDESGQLYVVERRGTIRLLTGELVLDISERVGSEGREQGLLGLAFHPRFAENRSLFLYYTDVNGDTVVSRFLMAEGFIDVDSEVVILYQDQPASNHNGGMLAFGPDGYLYIGLGDGGSSYDAFGTAQDLDSLLGKLLRIDVDAGDETYGIPPDNPFVDGSRPEVWAYGLRNPWRFSFDPLTADLYIGDVGQDMFEWVHFQPGDGAGGENYGWPIFEGDYCLIEERCDEVGFVPPIATYGREGGCAIIGGHVYRGAQIPALGGAYLFGDLCSGNIWATARDRAGEWQADLMLQSDAEISSFGLDRDGELYVTDLAGGRVLRVVSGGSD